MWRKRAPRGPDIATFTFYGRLEAVALLVVAFAACVSAGMLLGDGWPNRSASVAVWLSRCALQAAVVLMGVAGALFCANLARPRLSYHRQLVTTDSFGLTLTQDGSQKTLAWAQVEAYEHGAFQDVLAGAGERLLVSGGPALCANIRRHLPTGARFARVPVWYEWLGITAPASTEHSIIWPNQAIFRYQCSVIAGHLGVGLALLALTGIWVHRALSWAGIGPEFINEAKPAIAISAVFAALYAIGALVLVWAGVILLRHRHEAIETDDHGISMIRGCDRLTIPWNDVQRFEITRYHYRIVALDRVIVVAVPWFCGNPELQRIIERNLAPTSTYRRRRAWWHTMFAGRLRGRRRC